MDIKYSSGRPIFNAYKKDSKIEILQELKQLKEDIRHETNLVKLSCDQHI